MEWKIGNVTIKNQVVLAPMAGISNPSYMKICEEMGVGYAVTELISAEAIVRNNKKTLEMLNGIEMLNIPVAIQIFGSNPDTMAKASKILVDLHQIALIDINMGCPVPKVAMRAGAGSFLLKDPQKVYEMVSAVVDAISIPVTVKIRSGWDFDSINAVEIAKECEKAGASAICIHSRTRSQGYSGKADWNIIKQVKESVSIPVIGNGDIKSPEDALKMLKDTGCDAIMIGRAALGNPWILKNTVSYLKNFSEIVEPSVVDKFDMCLKHLAYLCEFKSERLACLEIRNHIAWYLKGVPESGEIKKKIYQCVKIHDIILILESYREEFINGKEGK